MSEIVKAVVGDADPDSGTCTVVLEDAAGQEARIIEAPEDDLIPYMRVLGYRLGVYLGNNTWAVL